MFTYFLSSGKTEGPVVIKTTNEGFGIYGHTRDEIRNIMMIIAEEKEDKELLKRKTKGGTRT